MGERGPAPKRSDRRLGHTSKASRAAVVKAPAGGKPTPPTAKRGWHPIAKMWFESLGESGQSAFYTSSDWSTAYAVAESMSREFKPQPVVAGETVQMVEMPPKAASLAAWLKAMSGLLVMEGDRRRVGLELVREKEPEPDVSELDEYRARIKSG